MPDEVFERVVAKQSVPKRGSLESTSSQTDRNL
jgi:hypothetical protein